MTAATSRLRRCFFPMYKSTLHARLRQLICCSESMPSGPASALSMMLTAGYPVEEAMQLAPSVVTDEKHRRQAEIARQELLSGGSFPQALEKSGLFDPMHEKMIRFGTAAGKLDAVMQKLSGIYMTEADDAIHNVIAMIEPALVAVLSIVIGGILLSVMLPLLSVLSAVG